MTANDPLYSQSEIIEDPDPEVIEKASPEAIIVLYRGCNKQDAEKMKTRMSAGGVPCNEGTGAPSESDVIAQVGEGAFEKMPDGTFQKKKLPEFTHDRSAMMMHRVAAGPGVQMGMVKVWIRRRYLVRGDKGIMQGWCTKKDAPIERWEWIPKSQAR